MTLSSMISSSGKYLFYINVHYTILRIIESLSWTLIRRVLLLGSVTEYLIWYDTLR